MGGTSPPHPLENLPLDTPTGLPYISALAGHSVAGRGVANLMTVPPHIFPGVTMDKVARKLSQKRAIEEAKERLEKWRAAADKDKAEGRSGLPELKPTKKGKKGG